MRSARSRPWFRHARPRAASLLNQRRDAGGLTAQPAAERGRPHCSTSGILRRLAGAPAPRRNQRTSGDRRARARRRRPWAATTTPTAARVTSTAWSGPRRGGAGDRSGRPARRPIPRRRGPRSGRRTGESDERAPQGLGTRVAGGRLVGEHLDQHPHLAQRGGRRHPAREGAVQHRERLQHQVVPGAAGARVRGRAPRRARRARAGRARPARPRPATTAATARSRPAAARSRAPRAGRAAASRDRAARDGAGAGSAATYRPDGPTIAEPHRDHRRHHQRQRRRRAPALAGRQRQAGAQRREDGRERDALPEQHRRRRGYAAASAPGTSSAGTGPASTTPSTASTQGVGVHRPRSGPLEPGERLAQRGDVGGRGVLDEGDERGLAVVAC